MEQCRTRRIQLLLAILVVIGLVTRWLDFASLMNGSYQNKLNLQGHSYEPDCSLNCSQIPLMTPNTIGKSLSVNECPQYFSWIHEDLKPWKETGITRDMVERGQTTSHIRIIIVNGRLYTVKYKAAFQTRDVVTIWGLLQLLRLYPGKLPDLDIMFELNDRPVVHKRDYVGENGSVPLPLPPPPVFHYCGDESSYDIVFPDWTFWGWPEVNIKPWEEMKEELKEANSKIKWKDREAYAYWKGNVRLGAMRSNLVMCNASNGHVWKARIYGTKWDDVKKEGFKDSDLASQCTHRYKVYVEGVSWSVSQKYILACDSMALVIKPRYYDFFTRSLIPLVHYWPIRGRDMCSAIKFAVEWGNKNTLKARRIGKSGSKFIQDSLAMKHIYDYSFHVLNEYAKLLRYKPTVPENAVEMCSNKMVCSVRGRKRRFRKHSMVKSPSDIPPCTLPRAYDPTDLQELLKRNENAKKQVMVWEGSPDSRKEMFIR